jgi:hypothetical protein
VNKCVASGFSRKNSRRNFRLTSLRQGYGGPPKRFAPRRKAEATRFALKLLILCQLSARAAVAAES